MMLVVFLLPLVATALPDWMTGGLRSGCTHVCSKDNCGYTWTNPLRKDTQYEVSKKSAQRGCCGGGKGMCDVCCVPGTGTQFRKLRSIEEGDMFRLEADGSVRLVEDDGSRATECVSQVGAPLALGAAAIVLAGAAVMVVNRKKEQYVEVESHGMLA